MPIMIRSISDAFARMSGMPINSKGSKNLLTVKAAYPEWKLGKPFSSSLLDHVSREDIEKSLHNKSNIDLQI